MLKVRGLATLGALAPVFMELTDAIGMQANNSFAWPTLYTYKLALLRGARCAE